MEATTVKSIDEAIDKPEQGMDYRITLSELKPPVDLSCTDVTCHTLDKHLIHCANRMRLSPSNTVDGGKLQTKFPSVIWQQGTRVNPSVYASILHLNIHVLSNKAITVVHESHPVRVTFISCTFPPT